jgi:uncharacterized DUF497 family protein
MDEIEFSWDARKARQNLQKHKASFEEAATVFYDENAIEFYDTGHSINEDRFLMLGLSGRLRIMVVSYCLRKEVRKFGLFQHARQQRRKSKYISKERNEERI